MFAEVARICLAAVRPAPKRNVECRISGSIAIAASLLLTVVSAAASDPMQNWVEVRSPHFTVLSNAGDREGRHVAEQFEQMRALFPLAFSKIRVDFGKPTIIFALKNEDSLKMFMPTYGVNKNAMHIAGRYSPTTDANFALVRTDVTGSGINAYHVLYHEYTHAVLRLNFRGLPLWLEEGLAEFYGNARFEGKQAIYGTPDTMALQILQRAQLVPISQLVMLDPSSPLYNTQQHAGIFYSESWALVHYLSLAPEVRDKKLIDQFLAALHDTDDPVEAANQSFGDLNKLADRLERYIRQFQFVAVRQPLDNRVEDKDFAARKLEPAEVLLQQANYLMRTGYREQALVALHAALEQDPKLVAIHDGLGYYHYSHSAYDDAEKEFDQALAVEPNDAIAFYYKANILLRRKGYTKESTPEIQKDLEKTIAMMPDFAPAHAFLCIAYSKMAETKPKAITEAARAMELDPGNLAYYIDIGRAYLANGKNEDAKRIADRAEKVATTSRDRAMAASFARQVAGKASASDVEVAENSSEPVKAASGEPSNLPKVETVDGQITELICGHAPEVMLTLSGSSQTLLHAKDVSKIEQKVNGSTAEKPLACGEWKDRKVKVTYTSAGTGAWQGELQSIDFQQANTLAGQ